MSDLTDFLLARIAEDEAVARGVQDEIRDQHARGVYRPGHGPDPDDAFVEHTDGPMDHPSVVVGPARMLAECEAKRRLIEVDQMKYGDILSDSGVYEMHEAACKFLALPYADHPEYREEWRP